MEVLSRRFTGAVLAVSGLVALYLVWLLSVLGGLDTSGTFDDVSEFVVSAIAAFFCWHAAREEESPQASRQWRWFALFALSWTAGEVYWTIYDLVGPSVTAVPVPSPADLGFSAALICALIAILQAPGAPVSGSGRIRLLLDGTIASGSLLFIAWVAVLDSVFGHSPTSLGVRLLSLEYPIGDLIVAGIGLSLFTYRQGRRAATTGLITGAFLLFALADSAFAYLNQTGAYESSSDPTDVGWFAGFLLLALAALVPARRIERARPAPRLSAWQLAFPYLPLAAATITAVIAAATGAHYSRFDVVDGLVVAAAVVGRQFLVLKQNEQLNTELETTVTELRANEATLRFQGFHDALTGLANRYLLAERLETALRAIPDDGLVAVVLIDLDDFKDVNDAYGHDVGDEILVEVGRRLGASVPASATVARIGADEFAVLVPDARSLESLGRLGETLGDALAMPFFLAASTVHLSACLGIATAPRGEFGIDRLLRNADIALDDAKRNGRGSRRIFDQLLGESFRDRATLRAELGPALENGEFFVEYQPILAAESGTIVGVEALVRWMHPRRGILYPDQFLRVAEATGVIGELGTWVLRESLGHLAKWRAELGAPAERLWVAVNVSARQFSLGDLLGAVREALGATGIGAGGLRLELTESLLIDQPRHAIEVLEQLRALGVALEIDDFGTGYSSLGYLQRMPIDAVKIDRSFVDGLGTDVHDTSIVGAVVALAHTLGLGVVAEGVETEAQLAHLRGLDCDEVQGFLFGRPLSPASIPDWLQLQAPVGGPN